MKHLLTFNESNISKVRKFPTYGDTHGIRKGREYAPDRAQKKWYEENKDRTDMYHIYDLNKRELGNYLNVWFPGEKVSSKDHNRYLKIHREFGDFIIRDEIWTVKKVDADTAHNLYNKKYNPISITIMCPTGGRFSTKEKLYNMKAQIHSVDDSSYGMWFNNMELSKLEDIKKKLMHWIDSKSEVNGDQWFELGKELGADDFDTN